MAGQASKNPDVDLIMKNVAEVASLGKAFFKGLMDSAEEIKMATNVDSTWGAATDKVEDKDTPEKDVDPFDLYLAELVRRAENLEKDGSINASAAVRRIIRELREMDAENA